MPYIADIADGVTDELSPLSFLSSFHGDTDEAFRSTLVDVMIPDG
jgi:hypothetical protein